MQCLRDHVTMPADPENLEISLTDAACGGRLPPVSCAFRGCSWSGGGWSSLSSYEDDCEHPWDQQLRGHIAARHTEHIAPIVIPLLGGARAQELQWDLYKGALSFQERRQMPCVGPSVDRRVFEYTSHVYNDQCIRSLICFACAQVHVDTGQLRSAIKFVSGTWFFGLPPGVLRKNFCMQEFSRKYRMPGTPLAFRGNVPHDIPVSYTHLTLPTKTIV